jgi:hypothetical protein
MGKRKSKKAQIEEKAKKSRGRGIGGLLVLIVAGAVAALIVSEPLRNKALDLLFGSEEEFQYTPPLENGASAPTDAAGA